MPRITIFFDTLARAVNYQRTVFLPEVQITYLHELGHYFGWDEEQIANVGLAQSPAPPCIEAPKTPDDND
jgi:predicted Zn-dependent protease with MMP-like domain